MSRSAPFLTTEQFHRLNHACMTAIARVAMDEPTEISDAEKPCDSTDAAPGSLIGYLVVLREHEAWNDSWDGTIHADAEAALKSCTEAFEAGYDAVLTEVRIK